MKQDTIRINHLYYTGEGDNARLFMEEMESSGTAFVLGAGDGILKAGTYGRI